MSLIPRNYAGGLWHGTTLRRHHRIEIEGLNPNSPFADSLYLPLTFACRRAEVEFDDAVILYLPAPIKSKYFVKMKGGFAARANERGDGSCYENKLKIPTLKIRLVDEIPCQTAIKLWHGRNKKQMYRKHLEDTGHSDISAIMQNWR